MMMAMAMMIETTKAVRFPPFTTPAANFCSLPRSSSVIHWGLYMSKMGGEGVNCHPFWWNSGVNAGHEVADGESYLGLVSLNPVLHGACFSQMLIRAVILHHHNTICSALWFGLLTRQKVCNEVVISQVTVFKLERNKFERLNGVSFLRRSSHLKSKIQASAENLDSNLDSSKQNGKLEYHPSEGIGELTSETISDAMLTPQETCRTIVEAKSKATLMLTGVINDDIHENIIWPDLPYVTDEHGNIYFQVKNDEDILQTLTTENNFVEDLFGTKCGILFLLLVTDNWWILAILWGNSNVPYCVVRVLSLQGLCKMQQAIIGFDATEMLSEMESLVNSCCWDLVAILDDDEEDDSDEDLGDWAKLETMSSSHPMFFAKKLAEVASDDPIDWMEQPPAGLAIQGLIRPAFMEEQSDIQRHMSGNQSRHAGTNQFGQNIEGKLEEPGVINSHEQNSESSEDISMWREESEKDEATSSGTSFYKLEMIKIQLISAHGHQTKVEVEDFRKAQPDVIALSAAKIISRLKAGGEKIMQAFKSLCWRCKGIQVEEAAIIDVDSLGFSLRVCSGTQIQTLRFAFNSRATSEYSAERQLNDLLFPRIQSRLQKKNIAKMP
ncbi:hypothetical protein SADUNF_Sadunf17G0134500 [Salix dunnii]|uniref:Pentatricopeptide repeat superfamily protein n=1 Tax=Salix dunnii TaxID=1413687 RepID=A0A835J6B8_9ROSI|nr:hypothetical protein SADUNF_Sadunf17G0134500 [Salix dunnii]